MGAVKDDYVGGAATRTVSRPPRAAFLRDITMQVMAEYESERTKKIGVAAFLADCLHDNPSFFLAQAAKLEPKSVAVESTHRSLTVVMHVDGAPEPMRLGSAPQAQLNSTGNATYRTLSDVVAEADKAEAPPQRTTGGGAPQGRTGPIQPGSRPPAAPPSETRRPEAGQGEHCSDCGKASADLGSSILSDDLLCYECILARCPHISKPSECVSDFSEFKNKPAQVPWDPNWHAVTRCPRCGVPVEYKGLVRNLPSYSHPVEGGDPVLIRQWARCPNSGSKS